MPWGSEVILEGVIESRKREIEGPFGEFTGHYPGGRNMTVVRIDKVSYRSKPIFESLYLVCRLLLEKKKKQYSMSSI
ncbi:phenolic acid decarboxylase subunit C [Salmonella enterica]|nr:phenolic acid decarboxylase subunit C [Salmonella enterica]